MFLFCNTSSLFCYLFCRCCQNDAQLLGECSRVTHIASMMAGKLHDGCSDAVCQEGGDPVREVSS